MAVLHAKLRAPAGRREFVPRPRLVEQLPVVAHRMPRVVLVAAPAGFGKTTLLTQWLAHAAEHGMRIAWLSLDASDSQPQEFLAHLVAALQAVDTEVGSDAAALVGQPDPPIADAVVSLINDLDVLAGPTIVVLDDYHLADGAGTHDALRTLVEHLPAQVTIAVSTREDPPLPLARLRAGGDLVEVRAADLRFTPAEAASLLAQVTGSALPKEAAAAIETRTEGWAAGLQLAGLAARGYHARGEVDEFVEAFTGSHRFVIDYLVDEVMTGLTGPVREFLLATSILDEMTGALCDALTGRTDGQGTLIELERSGLFVVGLDDRREWFRYHHLFAATLRAQLQAADPERVPALHRAAAVWLAENGAPLDALPHADAAGDGELTAEILELALPALRRDRRDRLIREWIQRVPEATIRTRSLLATVAAWARLSEGDLDSVTEWLDAAAAALGPASVHRIDPPASVREQHDGELRDVPAMIEVYRATVTQARGDAQATKAHAECAYARTGPDRHLARAAASGYLGLAAWAEGDLRTATEAFAEAIGSMRAAGNVADALGATVVLAEMWRGRGRLDEAQRLIRRALDEAERHRPVSSIGDLHVALATVLGECGALDEAEEHLEIARSFGDAASFPENRYRRHATEAVLLRARGRLAEASHALDEAAARYLPGFLPELEPLRSRQARLRIAQGDIGAAVDWARADGIALEHADYGRSHRLLTLIRLLIAQHRAGSTVDLTAANAILAETAATAFEREQFALAAEALLLRAIVLEVRGDRAAAVVELESALGTVDRGFARLFLDEAPAVAPLLEAISNAVPRSAQRGGAAELVRMLGEGASDAGDADGRPPPDEGLSTREVEVLRLLAGDLTGPEIAAHLYVSVNTLRSHTKHIFIKLEVNTRRAAVRKASELGLI